MENVLKIHDGRINADNYLFEITIRDYYDIVKDRNQEKVPPWL